MPPYVIAHDATLLAIAEARPRSLAALRRVKGMGEAKLERYGNGILAVLAALEAAPEPTADAASASAREPAGTGADPAKPGAASTGAGPAGTP
jgi:ATP-dependent DNA helicase RecQ